MPRLSAQRIGACRTADHDLGDWRFGVEIVHRLPKKVRGLEHPVLERHIRRVRVGRVT